MSGDDFRLSLSTDRDDYDHQAVFAALASMPNLRHLVLGREGPTSDAPQGI
jgi:hypothetical protein